MSKCAAVFTLDNFGDSYVLRAISQQTGRTLDCTVKVYDDCSIAQQVQLISVMLEALEQRMYREALEKHTEYLDEAKALRAYCKQQNEE